MNKACLLVTNIFPPALGGSSQVYAALAASARGQIVVLTSSCDHETGRERAGWQIADRQANYPVHRVRCVRPFLRGKPPNFFIACMRRPPPSGWLRPWCSLSAPWRAGGLHCR